VIFIVQLIEKLYLPHMQTVVSPKPLVLLLILSAIIFMASLYHRQITFDDAFFAEQAYWVNKDGYVRSELFSTFKDWGERQYIYLKLHVWQTALVAQVFGWSAYFFKMIPLAYFCLFVYLSHYYFRRYLASANITTFYLFLILLLINTYIVHFSFENRPEIAQMCLGFLSFLAIRHGIQVNKALFLFLAGMLAGTTVLLHFNGLVFISAGAGLIIYLRQTRTLFLFLLGAAIIAPVYWYEMFSNHAVGTALDQLRNYPSLAKGHFSLKNLVLKFLFAPQRYFQHLFDASYTLLFILTLYFNRHSIKENKEVKILLVYFVLAELTLALIGPDAKAIYMVIYMPYVLFIIAIYNHSLFQKPLNRTMLVAFSFYAITQLGHVMGMIGDRNSEIIQQHAQIFNKYHIRSTDKIFAPSLFVFNEIGHAKITASENLLSGRKLSIGINTDSKDVLKYADKHGYQYLILMKGCLPDLTETDLIVNRAYSGYELVGRDYGYYILHKI